MSNQTYRLKFQHYKDLHTVSFAIYHPIWMREGEKSWIPASTMFIYLGSSYTDGVRLIKGWGSAFDDERITQEALQKWNEFFNLMNEKPISEAVLMNPIKSGDYN